MTGGEIVAAGKAVEAVGKKVLTEDDKTKDVLLRVSEETPEMKAAARSFAARTAVKERIKLLLYWPFARMLGVSQEYFEEKFPQEMGERIADIPEENLVTPIASVAVPALQGLSYTFEEPNLKDMFLGLLVTASDNRRANQAHPAFADIIKQLSAAEAQLLNVTLEANRSIPTVRVINQTVNQTVNWPDGSFDILIPHLLNLAHPNGELAEAPLVPMWVDNWIRLRLVEVSYSEWVSAENSYNWVESRPEYRRLIDDEGQGALGFMKGLLRPSSFGRQFFNAVH